MNDVKLLDVVALLEDLSEEGLRRGQVGTVVEVFGDEPNRPDGFLVEFSDRSGQTPTLADLRAHQLINFTIKKPSATQPSHVPWLTKP